MTPVSRAGSWWPAAAAAGAGRERTRARTMSADAAKVAASMIRDQRVPKNPVTAPPAAKPRTCANWYVVSVTAVPITYFSPSSTSG